MAKYQRKSAIPITPLEFEGEIYNLKYNYRAYEAAEMALTKAWGKRTTIPGLLGDIFDQSGSVSMLSNKLSVMEMCILFWAGQLHEHPDLTLNEVSDFLEFADLITIMPTIIEAIGKTLVKSENTNVKNDQTPQE